MTYSDFLYNKDAVIQFVDDTYIEAMSKLSNDVKRIVIALPSQCGKSTLLFKIAKNICINNGENTLYIVSGGNLVDQQKKRMLSDLPATSIVSFYDLKADNFNILINYKIIFVDGLTISERRHLAPYLKNHPGYIISTCEYPFNFLDVNGDSIPPLVFETECSLSVFDTYLYDFKEQQLLIKQFEALKRKNEQLENNNKNLAAKNKELTAENIYYRDLLTNAGLDIVGIDENLKQIKSHLIEQLESSNIETSETAYAYVVIKTIETLKPVLNNTNFINDSKEYELELKNRLTEKVWNNLCEETKNFIKTACFVFAQLKETNQNNQFDFSCVCILITKALELETTRVFYDGYIKYLMARKLPFEEWPEALLDKKFLNKPINREFYMLGSVVHTAGLSNSSYKQGEVKLICPDENRKIFNMIFGYYKNDLLKNYNGNISQKIINDCSIVEQVRIKYRNPCAHKDCVSLADAQNCIDFLLLEKRKMFYMLNDMY